MPSKYVTRNFTKGGIYHITNRGVENRTIFTDDKDYSLFLYYLSAYVMPVEKALRFYRDLPPRLFAKNLSKEVEILSYCLLPNRFHLLVKQNSIDGVTKLMKQLTNAYTQYFNENYHHTGPLLAGRYKAVEIPNKQTLSLISRFIHVKPILENLTFSPEYKWSSYKEYIEPSRNDLCSTDILLSQFPSIYAYKKFVQDQKDYSRQLPKIGMFTLEGNRG